MTSRRRPGGREGKVDESDKTPVRSRRRKRVRQGRWGREEGRRRAASERIGSTYRIYRKGEGPPGRLESVWNMSGARSGEREDTDKGVVIYTPNVSQ